jgi:hypothetical protein
MAPPRPTPFALVFGTAAERFASLREGIAASGHDPASRDAFLLVREVAELLYELRPAQGAGEAIAALAAFLHFAYLFWMDGERVLTVSEPELAQLLSDSPPVRPSARPPVRPSVYWQLPALRVWGTPEAAASAEPLDGWFVVPRTDPVEPLSALAVFGLNPQREGFTTVELAGPRPPPHALQRPDGSALFSSTLTGGAAAGLSSLAGSEELLELAWRAEALR